MKTASGAHEGPTRSASKAHPGNIRNFESTPGNHQKRIVAAAKAHGDRTMGASGAHPGLIKSAS